MPRLTAGLGDNPVARTLRLPRDLDNRLTALAAGRNWSASLIIVTAIADYLDKAEASA